MKKNFKNKLIKKDEWFLRGDGFSVSITHVNWKGISFPLVNSMHAWCLYVTINSKHALFNEACKNSIDYDTNLGDKLYPNFHCGCTYYCKQKDYVKIGCDYQHLDDDVFMASAELPDEILRDAEALWIYMNGSNERR